MSVFNRVKLNRAKITHDVIDGEVVIINLVNGNYYRLFAGNNANHEAVAPEPLEMKVSELYFLCDNGETVEFDVVAGLTSIPASRTTTDTGPSWSGSAGVG